MFERLEKKWNPKSETEKCFFMVGPRQFHLLSCLSILARFSSQFLSQAWHICTFMFLLKYIIVHTLTHTHMIVHRHTHTLTHTHTRAHTHDCTYLVRFYILDSCHNLDFVFQVLAYCLELRFYFLRFSGLAWNLNSDKKFHESCLIGLNQSCSPVIWYIFSAYSAYIQCILEYSFNIPIWISCLDGTQMFDPKHDNCATLFSWLTIKPCFSFYQTKNYCIIWPNWIRRFTAHYPIDKRPERSVDRPLRCLIFPNISLFSNKISESLC